MQEVKSTSLFLPVDLWQRLKIAAITHNLLIKDIVYQFIRDGLDRLDAQDGGN